MTSVSNIRGALGESYKISEPSLLAVTKLAAAGAIGPGLPLQLRERMVEDRTVQVVRTRVRLATNSLLDLHAKNQQKQRRVAYLQYLKAERKAYGRGAPESLKSPKASTAYRHFRPEPGKIRPYGLLPPKSEISPLRTSANLNTPRWSRHSQS